jgi:hypothetical protein
MTTKGTWATLMRWLGTSRQRRGNRKPDFGDHGTAFGLDLSMAPEVIAPSVPNTVPAGSGKRRKSAGFGLRAGR